MPQGVVTAVSQAGGHGFSKQPRLWITLLAGLGVEGDAHAGVTVKHRSRVARDASQPNLRQVHLLQAELLAELAAKGFNIGPGQIGENVLTAGVDLLGLPWGRVCGWVKPRWWRSPGCGIHAYSSTGSGLD